VAEPTSGAGEIIPEGGRVGNGRFESAYNARAVYEEGANESKIDIGVNCDRMAGFMFEQGPRYTIAVYHGGACIDDKFNVDSDSDDYSIATGATFNSESMWQNACMANF
jgi:hypothetical protein